MTGNLFVKLLIAQYLAAACLFLWEGNWPKAGYWIGASIITTSVLWMK